MMCTICIQCNILLLVNTGCFFSSSSNSSLVLSCCRTNHMRIAVAGCVKVQLSHCLDSRNSRCLRKRTVKRTGALSCKHSWPFQPVFGELGGLTLHTLLKVLWEPRGKKIIYLVCLVGSKSPSTMVINVFRSKKEKIWCAIGCFDITVHGRAQRMSFPPSG